MMVITLTSSLYDYYTTHVKHLSTSASFVVLLVRIDILIAFTVKGTGGKEDTEVFLSEYLSHVCWEEACASMLAAFFLTYFITSCGSEKPTLTPTEVDEWTGQNITLSCSRRNETLVNIIWLLSLDEQSLQGVTGKQGSNCVSGGFFLNSTTYSVDCIDDYTFNMTIKNITQKQHNNNVSCVALSLESNRVNIKVKIPVKTVTLTPTTLTLNESDTIALHCTTSKCRPQPLFYWFVNDDKTPERSLNSSTQSNGNLIEPFNSTFYDVANRSMDGWCITCGASNQIPYNSTVVKSTSDACLDIKYPPDGYPQIDNFTNNSTYYVADGSTVSLNCFVGKSKPAAELSWKLQPSILLTNTTTSNSSIGISWIAKRRNGTTCTCLSSHILQTSVKEVTLQIDVLYPPETPVLKINATLAPATVYTIENRTLDAVCQSSSNPPSNITWTYCGNFSSHEPEIAVIITRTKQACLFKCEATNIIKTTNGVENSYSNCSSFVIDVLYPPERMSLRYLASDVNGTVNKTLNVVRGDSFQIKCSAFGNPSPIYKWEKTSRDGDTIQVTANESDILLTCFATNDMNQTAGPSEQGKANITVNITVSYPPGRPVFRLNDKDILSELFVIEGRKLNVSCSATSNPQCNISWKFCNDRLQSGSILLIPNVSRHEACNFLCNASNQVQPTFGNQHVYSNTSSFVLKVLYPPENFSVRYMTEKYNHTMNKTLNVIRGDSFNLGCSAAGNPSPICHWDNSNDNRDILPFSDIKSNEIRTCVATNEMNQTAGPSVTGMANITVEITVSYQPDTPVIKTGSQHVTGIVEIIENGTLNVSCEASGRPEPNFRWQYCRDASSAGKHLLLNNIKRDRLCNFTCLATNDIVPTFGIHIVGRNSTTFLLQVLYPPVLAEPKNISVEEGELVEMNCLKEYGVISSQSVTWSNRTGLISVTNETLSLRNITRDKSGVYGCRVHYTMSTTAGMQENGNRNTSFLLNVLYKSAVSNFSVLGYGQNQAVTVNENDSVRMSCHAESNPAGTVELRFVDLLQNTSNNNTASSELYAQCNNTGTYWCSVYNYLNNGTSSIASLELFVKCKPRLSLLSRPRQNITSAQNVSATFTFSVVAYPYPVFVLYKVNETEKTELSEVHFETQNTSKFQTQVNFTINRINQTKYGEYLVVVENERGMFEQMFYLIPAGRPDPPKTFDFYAEMVTETSITLWWDPGFNGGLSQHFTIMYKLLSEISWRNATQVIDEGTGKLSQTVHNLLPGSNYVFRIFSTNDIGTARFPYDVNVTTKATVDSTSSPQVGLAVGGAVGGLLGILVVAAILGFILWKRRSKKPSTDKKEDKKHLYENVTILPDRKPDQRLPATPTNFDDEVGVSQSIDEETMDDTVETEYQNCLEMADLKKVGVSELFAYVSNKTTESFLEEYEKLPKGLIANIRCSFARKPENVPLNRYQGIYPYDHTRVNIPAQPSFFINANYIDGFKRRRTYIASLGPTKRHTHYFKTFWNMVWFEQSDVIVMLTNLSEPSGMKCEQYWPDHGKSKDIDDFVILSEKEEVTAEYTVRTFTVTLGSESRKITQLHFTAWPDKTVPESVISLIEFRQRVKTTPTQSLGPLIVHCSAGIGRTGTYIALDRLIEEGKSRGSVNIFDCVMDMRKQRVNMVQTAEQYLYLHQALVYSLLFDTESVTAETIGEYIQATSNNAFSQLYQQLKQTVEKESEEYTKAEVEHASFVELNRRKADIPGNRHRVLLTLDKAFGESNYINAIYLSSFLRLDHFIVAQSPLPKTVEDFVGMLYQTKSICIVALDDYQQKGTNNATYLPAENEQFTYGFFSISCISVEVKPAYIVRKLKLGHAGKLDEGERIAYHFEFTEWQHVQQLPKDPTTFVEFVREVDDYSTQLQEKESHVVVHCMTGCERSGLFCAVSNLIQKMELEKRVNAVNSLRRIRERRKTAIPSMEQLKFCYQAVNAFVRKSQFLSTRKKSSMKYYENNVL